EPPAGAPALGPRPGVRRRPRARVARAHDDGAPAGNPELDDLRLRVRLAPASARVPRRYPCRRAGLDPARPPRPLRRRAAEAPPVPGSQGGVLPRRFRAGPPRPRAVADRPVARARRPASAARRLALPPACEPAL